MTPPLIRESTGERRRAPRTLDGGTTSCASAIDRRAGDTDAWNGLGSLLAEQPGREGRRRRPTARRSRRATSTRGTETDSVAARILLHFDADSEKIRTQVIRTLAGPGGRPQHSRVSEPAPGKGGTFERFTQRARQVIVLAERESRELGHEHIGSEHILLGLLREREGLAGRALEGLAAS